jgi:hypothetical protein
MNDLWSNLGAEISVAEGDWLYRVGDEVHGPLPFQVLADRLAAGDLDFDTPVAREGGAFHPLRKVAAFEPYFDKAQEAAAKRRRRRTLKLVGIGCILLVLGMGGGGAWFWHRAQVAKRARLAALHAREVELQKQREARDQLANAMALVGLVSIDSEKDIHIRSKAPGRRAGPRAGPEGAGGEAPMVSECGLSQAQIFQVLKTNLGKINVCVEDEKKRDAASLPETLELSFVIQPSGSTVDFMIGDRHYRTGPMNNCMIKAFRTFAFPTSTGANCPVTIPIRIGNK